MLQLALILVFKTSQNAISIAVDNNSCRFLKGVDVEEIDKIYIVKIVKRGKFDKRKLMEDCL